MSAGPIAQERASHKPPKVSSTAKERVCAAGTGLNATTGRGYCGRTSAPRVDSWAKVTCADCYAARRADEAVGA